MVIGDGRIVSSRQVVWVIDYDRLRRCRAEVSARQVHVTGHGLIESGVRCEQMYSTFNDRLVRYICLWQHVTI